MPLFEPDHDGLFVVDLFRSSLFLTHCPSALIRATRHSIYGPKKPFKVLISRLVRLTLGPIARQTCPSDQAVAERQPGPGAGVSSWDGQLSDPPESERLHGAVQEAPPGLHGRRCWADDVWLPMQGGLLAGHVDEDLTDTVLAAHLHVGADYRLDDHTQLGLRLSYSMLGAIEDSGAYTSHRWHAEDPVPKPVRRSVTPNTFQIAGLVIRIGAAESSGRCRGHWLSVRPFATRSERYSLSPP